MTRLSTSPPRTVEVRDTKDGGTGPVMRFTGAEFAAWLDGAGKGELDHLLGRAVEDV